MHKGFRLAEAEIKSVHTNHFTEQVQQPLTDGTVQQPIRAQLHFKLSPTQQYRMSGSEHHADHYLSRLGCRSSGMGR